MPIPSSHGSYDLLTLYTGCRGSSHFTLRMVAWQNQSIGVPVAVLRQKPLLRDTCVASFVFQSLPLAGQTGASDQQIVQPVSQVITFTCGCLT